MNKEELIAELNLATGYINEAREQADYSVSKYSRALDIICSLRMKLRKDRNDEYL